MPKRHVIRPDVKAQILKRLKEEGVPVAKLAEEHGISTKPYWHPSGDSKIFTNRLESLLGILRLQQSQPHEGDES